MHFALDVAAERSGGRVLSAFWAACCALILWASGAAAQGPKTASAPAKDTAAWPTSRGDNTNSGRSADGKDAVKGEVAWKFMASAPVTATPVAADGVLYVACQDSTLLALDRHLGKLLWQTPRRADNDGYTFSCPVVADSAVVAATQGGIVTAFARRDGAKIWERKMPGEIYSSLRFADGKILFGCNDNFFHALNVADGTIAWSYECGDDVGGSAAITKAGKVIFTSHDKFLHIVDLKSGKSVQKFNIGYRSTGQILVARGCAYFCMTGRKYGSVDLLSGEIRWTAEALNENQQGSCIWEGKTPEGEAKTLVFVHIGRYVFGFDADSGRQVIKEELGGSGCVSPALGTQYVYFADVKGGVYALDPSTGAKKWRLTVEAGSHCSPILLDGSLYIGDGAGWVYCIR